MTSPITRRRAASTLLALASAPWARAQALPVYVDLTNQQTPPRPQGPRDTCGTFTALAAVEAAYKRLHGLTLNLSPQYLNHWAQQFSGVRTVYRQTPVTVTLPWNETPSGAIGGGGLPRPLEAMLLGLAVPPESTLAYQDSPGYQEPDPGDVPNIHDWQRRYEQRTVDDFNLGDLPQWIVHTPPLGMFTTVMPQAALDDAAYRATQVRWFTPAELRDITAYRRQLAAGREVMVEVKLYGGDHAVLLIGYDDGQQLFKVKNPWGRFEHQPYASVLSTIYRAGVIEAVLPPTTPRDPFRFRHYFLGRWQLTFDGWHGVLDIYNLPDPQVPLVVGNHRVGTLFLPDGRMARVNGTTSGNALTFWVNWADRNQLPSVLNRGDRFTVHLFSRNHRAMAGSVRDTTGMTWGVQGLKGTAPVRGNARPGPLSVSTYLGTWDFQHDGWKGRLEITGANPSTRVLTGQYVDDRNRRWSLTGRVATDARAFQLTIGFAAPAVFSGYLNGHQLGVMSGTTSAGALQYGFLGTRR